MLYLICTAFNFSTQNTVHYQPQVGLRNVHTPKRAPQYIEVTVVILVINITLGNIFGLICIVAALICACTVSGYYKLTTHCLTAEVIIKFVLIFLSHYKHFLHYN